MKKEINNVACVNCDKILKAEDFEQKTRCYCQGPLEIHALAKMIDGLADKTTEAMKLKKSFERFL